METSVRISRGVFQIFHRQKKRTAKAEFISAFTGSSTKSRGSPSVAAWATTYSTTRLRQFALNLEVRIRSPDEIPNPCGWDIRPKGAKWRSAARDQSKKKLDPDAVATKLCLPGSRNRAPVYGVPSSNPLT